MTLRLGPNEFDDDEFIVMAAKPQCGHVQARPQAGAEMITTPEEMQPWRCRWSVVGDTNDGVRCHLYNNPIAFLNENSTFWLDANRVATTDPVSVAQLPEAALLADDVPRRSRRRINPSIKVTSQLERPFHLRARNIRLLPDTHPNDLSLADDSDHSGRRCALHIPSTLR